MSLILNFCANGRNQAVAQNLKNVDADNQRFTKSKLAPVWRQGRTQIGTLLFSQLHQTFHHLSKDVAQANAIGRVGLTSDFVDQYRAYFLPTFAVNDFQRPRNSVRTLISLTSSKVH